MKVTGDSMAAWIAKQITEAFPWDQALQYIIWGRDASYGYVVTGRLAAVGIQD
jgi:hypothetical protein